jgi:hypothetical protein
MKINDIITENLHKWFKEKWVRFGSDGKIKGPCARGSSKEGKPKCLPQAKAHSLGKKKRATAARRKRREDPNPNRSGKAHNVRTEAYDYGNMHGVAEIPKTLLKHGWVKRPVSFDKTVFKKKGVGIAELDRNQSGFVRFTIKGQPYTTYGHEEAIELLNKLDPITEGKVSDADIAYLAARQIIKGYTFNELNDIVEQLFRLAKKYNMNLNDFVEARNAVLANKRTTKEALELLLKPFKAAAERASRNTLEATSPIADDGDTRGAALGAGRSKTTLEDSTGEYAAQRTPEENPYGGLRSRKFRGAISETPNESPVGYQPGGWRIYEPKVSGLEEMDSFDNYTPYKAEPAGLKETDFKKTYYTLIVNGKSITTSNDVKKLHELAKDYKKEKPDAEIKVKSSDGVDEGIKYTPLKKQQKRVLYIKNRPVMYFGINDTSELLKALAFMKEKHPTVKVEVKKEFVSETSSTGAGGGSAGIGGGGGVGIPATYEEEYGPFQRKGTRKTMSLTF